MFSLKNHSLSKVYRGPTMKKITALILSFLIMLSTTPTIFAATEQAINAADALFELGLFNGIGTDKTGKPIYDLDRVPTREECVTMLVRLLGKETVATSQTWDMPFDDISEWAKGYVGYAYNEGLTNGISVTKFGGTEKITAQQYITFMLRALGYSSNTDFSWDQSLSFSDNIGLTNGEYADPHQFTRGDVVKISYAALNHNIKQKDITLYQKLFPNYAITDHTDLPGVLTDIRVVPGYGQVKIYGTEISDKEPTGYEIYSSTSIDGTYTEHIYTTGIDQSGSLINNLEGNTTYYFKIRSLTLVKNTDGSYTRIYSDFSPIISATPYPALDITVNTPKIISATSEDNSITLTWNYDDSVDYYSLYEDGIYSFSADKVYKNTYTFENLEGGKEYCFNVVATKIVAGQEYHSDFSEPYYAVAVNATPKIPSEILEQIKNYYLEAVENEKKALECCMSSLAARPKGGLYYAKEAQSYFLKAYSATSAASDLCKDYDELGELQALFLLASAYSYASGNCTINSYNYLDFVILVCESSNEPADIYEDILEILLPLTESNYTS